MCYLWILGPGHLPAAAYGHTNLEGLVGKSRNKSIEAIADALSDTKDEVWERTFDIVKPQRAKRKGKAKKGVAALAVLGGLGYVLTKRREQATAVAKTAADKGSTLAKSVAEKGSAVAKEAAGKAKDLKNSRKP